MKDITTARSVNYIMPLNEAPIELFLNWFEKANIRGGKTFTPVTGITYNLEAFSFVSDGNISSPWTRYETYYQPLEEFRTLALCCEFLSWAHIFYAYTGEYLWKLTPETLTWNHLNYEVITVSTTLREKLGTRPANINNAANRTPMIFNNIMNALMNDGSTNGDDGPGGVLPSAHIEIIDSDSLEEDNSDQDSDGSGVDDVSFSLATSLSALLL